MQYDTRHRSLTIPVYDIGTLAAGFYIGYSEGKGIDVSQSVEYLTKYIPTVAALCLTPIMLKATYAFGKWTNKKSLQNLQHGNFEITLKDKTWKYKDMDKYQRKEIKSKIMNNVNNIESKLQDKKYLKPTLIAGTRTAIETIIGYAAGRLYSQMG